MIQSFSSPGWFDGPRIPRLLHAAQRRLHRLKLRMRVDRRDRYAFSIGIFEGRSPTRFWPSSAARNPVLTRDDINDVPAAFVADPFMIDWQDRWLMFFEIMNQARDRGEIGYAVSDDLLDWRYGGVALREDFHLSYPHVFAWNGQLYMLPETYGAGDIRLYRCDGAPDRWSVATTLLEIHGSEPTLVHHQDKWWLFTETAPHCTYDCLRLFCGESLDGHWHEHPQSPLVLGNPRTARPGGRIVAVDGRLFRYAQDCLPEYGTRVRVLEILTLTPTTYREKEIGDAPLLSPSGDGWNAFGMHHIDAHQLMDGRWIACVDGR